MSDNPDNPMTQEQAQKLAEEIAALRKEVRERSDTSLRPADIIARLQQQVNDFDRIERLNNEGLRNLLDAALAENALFKEAAKGDASIIAEQQRRIEALQFQLGVANKDCVRLANELGGLRNRVQQTAHTHHTIGTIIDLLKEHGHIE